MKKINSSIRFRLFLTLSIIIVVIVFLLMIINTFIYKPFFIYSKQYKLKGLYNDINTYYNSINTYDAIMPELEKMALMNGVDILIRSREGVSVYASNKDFIKNIPQIENMNIETLEKNDNIIIGEMDDKSTGIKFIVLYGKIDNGNFLIIRLPISFIEENVQLSNMFLYITGTCVIIVSGFIILFITKNFTKPILELEEIAEKVSNLDFSKKYQIKDNNDEIDKLGKSINLMSEELEKTIVKLQEKNIGLEKDIEEKSKIDEMRKQFISDVSHELKTPIALIQGYAEGLKENINSDEESRNYYVDVILDETTKMDTLVKKLLELMKLEHQVMEFRNANFDIVELINEIIRKSEFIINEKNIKIKFDDKNKIIVNADEFYTENVITNYLTNAIKYATEINGENYIEISVIRNNDKVRITVFNTGDRISVENMSKIWDRFYKVDISRNREDGSTGIGLAFVKAIMNNYNNDYGVINRDNGVEFYFELDSGNE